MPQQKSYTPTLATLPQGTLRLRWRQNEQQSDGSVQRVQRSVMATDRLEALRLSQRIEEALRTHGFWEPELKERHRPPPLTLSDAIGEWITVRSIRWQSPATVTAVETSLERFLKALGAVLHEPRPAALSMQVLDAHRFRATVANMQERYAQSTVYQSAFRALELWRFIHHNHPSQCATPPFEAAEVLPNAPLHAPPAQAANWFATDACLNHITHPRALRLSTLMRYTGLRISQAAALATTDFDHQRHTLMVRTGKSRRERALCRVMAVSPHLFEDLGPWLKTCPPGPIFPHREDPSQPIQSPRNLSVAVSAGWAAATAAGLVPEAVWRPPNREQGTPDHAFRTAFQQELADAGVTADLLDHLVGHSPSSTRGRHYVKPSAARQQAAVALIPRVVWTAPSLARLRGQSEVNSP